MSFLFRALGDTPDTLVPIRMQGSSKDYTPAQAMRHSAVWACTRLRAGLVSSLPVCNTRQVGGLSVPLALPAVLRKPGALTLGGKPVGAAEWLYATQSDLDRLGNAFGVIVERDAALRPSRIDLVSASAVSVSSTSGQVTYKVGDKTYTPEQIWHERQYVVAGLAVGLSPIAYAAYSLGGYFDAQQFAASWFSSGSAPAGHLRNTAKVLATKEAQKIKTVFKSSVANGDVFVSGNDWEYSMLGVDAKQTEFINAQQFSISDACRFFDVPGDLIDAEGSSSKITYANITQRNMQLLILHLGPAIARRESALQDLTASPQMVSLDRGALLAMDPLTRAQWIHERVNARSLTPDEARAMDNLPPLTSRDVELFNRLFNRQWRHTETTNDATSPLPEETL